MVLSLWLSGFGNPDILSVPTRALCVIFNRLPLGFGLPPHSRVKGFVEKDFVPFLFSTYKFTWLGVRIENAAFPRKTYRLTVRVDIPLPVEN